MPNKGDEAPDFELLSDEGQPVKLSDFRGQNVVLYFYPADFTGGCELQACAFRDAYQQIEERDAVVVGVSPDGVESHRKFREALNLPFHLLSDPDMQVANLYDSTSTKTREDGSTVKRIQRGQYIVDKEGKIAAVQAPVQPAQSRSLALEGLGVRGLGLVGAGDEGE